MNPNQLRKKRIKAYKALKQKYVKVTMRKFELQNTLGHFVQYYVTKPQTIREGATLEDFGDLGCLVY